jgi:hypothetical protein
MKLSLNGLHSTEVGRIKVTKELKRDGTEKVTLKG